MISHKGTQTLHTMRLVLRRFTVDDADDMYNNWARDSRVTRFLSWKPHASVEETKELIKTWCLAYENSATYNWIIEFEGKAIGNVSVVRLSEKREWAEIGYCMGCEYWNKGLMTEAVGAVIDYLFKQVGFHRIEIAHAVKNPASGRVAQKCGLIYEGTKRESFKGSLGEFLDVAYYSILRHEWLNR